MKKFTVSEASMLLENGDKLNQVFSKEQTNLEDLVHYILRACYQNKNRVRLRVRGLYDNVGFVLEIDFPLELNEDMQIIFDSDVCVDTGDYTERDFCANTWYEIGFASVRGVGRNTAGFGSDLYKDKEVKDDKTRFAILNHYLDGFKGTVFRQTQFAEFEHAIHEADASGQILTAEFMNKIYADLNEKYYNLKAEDNYEIQFEWERIPHFYMNYYVYQYATGFAAASYLAEKIVHGNEEDKEAYLTYLKAGSSDYPLEVIKKAGVDMTNTDYLDAAFKVFEDRLVELEALVEKGVHLS